MSLVWYSQYHGDEWEKMCDALLALKHGADFQPISDKGGDLGLDGLVVSQGIAYQAYGQEPENQDPAKGVKSKIHTDLAKLKKNQDGIVKLLGGKKISRWVLLLNKEIPHNNIHTYAKSKQDEVVSWQLSFVGEGFQVVIQTPTYFETEYLEYQKRRDDRVEVDIPLQASPSMENIRLNEKFIAVFDKFRRITDTDEDAERFAYNEIRNYIENAIQLDEIQKREPDFYSAIEEVRSDVEYDADQGSILSGSNESYSSTKQTLEDRLTNKIGARLGTTTLARVRKYIISDWFVRCPLNFKKKSGAL